MARMPHGATASMDVDSARWVECLSSKGPQHDAAVAELHEMLLQVARRETSRRSGTSGVRGVELDDIAHQAAGDAVVSILRKVPEFRGDSRFSTWAYKFAVFEVSTKLSRHVWRRHPVHLDEDAWGRLPGRLGASPAESAEASQLAGAIRHAVEVVLTARQRQVFLALVVAGKPLDVLAGELQMNRNAVYKAMFDARRKLRAHLADSGYLHPEEGLT